MTHPEVEPLPFVYVRIEDRRHFFRKDRTLEMFAGAMGFPPDDTDGSSSVQQMHRFTAGKVVLCRTSSLHHREARAIAGNGAKCVYIQDPTLNNSTINHSDEWTPTDPDALINGLQANLYPGELGSGRSNKLRDEATQDLPNIPWGKQIKTDIIFDFWSDGLLLPQPQARNYIITSIKHLNAGGTLFVSPPGRLLQMLEQTAPQGAITLRQKLQSMGAEITYVISKEVYPSHIRIDKGG